MGQQVQPWSCIPIEGGNHDRRTRPHRTRHHHRRPCGPGMDTRGRTRLVHQRQRVDRAPHRTRRRSHHRARSGPRRLRLPHRDPRRTALRRLPLARRPHRSRQPVHPRRVPAHRPRHRHDRITSHGKRIRLPARRRERTPHPLRGELPRLDGRTGNRQAPSREGRKRCPTLSSPPICIPFSRPWPTTPDGASCSDWAGLRRRRPDSRPSSRSPVRPSPSIWRCSNGAVS